MKKILSFTLALLMLMSTFSAIDLTAFAQDYPPVSYTINKVDKSKRFKNKYGKTLQVALFYKKVTVKGNSAIIKKINTSINNDCYAFFKSESAKDIMQYGADYAKSMDSFESLKETSKSPARIYYYASSKVTYNKNNLLSIRVITHWWAGGVYNEDVYGLTYSLKTGNKLSLSNVCYSDDYDTKEKILYKVEHDDDISSEGINMVKKQKVSSFDYYISKNNRAVVCFGDYELASGGFVKLYSISRY